MVLLTEWNEFRRPDFDRIKLILKSPVIFDGRNQYDAKRMVERGFHYVMIGRPPMAPETAAQTLSSGVKGTV